MSKKNLTYIVSIAWQSNSDGRTETRLRTSIYFEYDVSSEDEALGKAISEQRKALDESERFNMLVHNTATTWQTEVKADLNCLRYC